MIYFQTSDLKVNEKNYMMVHGAMIVFLAGCTTLVNIDVDDAIDDLEEQKDSVQKIESVSFKVQAENEAQYVVSEPKEVVVAVPVIEKKQENDTE